MVSFSTGYETTRHSASGRQAESCTQSSLQWHIYISMGSVFLVAIIVNVLIPFDNNIQITKVVLKCKSVLVMSIVMK